MAKDVLERILRGRPLDRRSLMKAMAGAGVGMAAMPLLPQAAGAADEALVYTWSGYNDPKLYPAYVAKHGSPTFSFLGDTQEANASTSRRRRSR
jgi:spermidine/putrescine transport system substrate-binding protein